MGSRHSLRDTEKRISEYPQRVRNLIISLIERLLTHRNETYDIAMRNLAAEMGMKDIDDETLRGMMVATREAGNYINAYVREEVIRYVMASGLKIDIFGNGWDDMYDAAGVGTTFHNGVSYERTAALAAQAKIVLNVMPWFKDGCHDRIGMTMLNGAVSCSDESGYLKENFENSDTPSILLYSISEPDRLPEMLNKALSDKDILFNMAKNGKTKAEELLSPEAHARKMDKIFKKYA